MEIGLSLPNMLTHVNRIVNTACEGMCDHFMRNKVFTFTSCNFCISTHIPEREFTRLSLTKFCSVVCLQETFAILCFFYSSKIPSQRLFRKLDKSLRTMLFEA